MKGKEGKKGGVEAGEGGDSDSKVSIGRIGAKLQTALPLRRQEKETKKHSKLFEIYLQHFNKNKSKTFCNFMGKKRTKTLTHMTDELH